MVVEVIGTQAALAEPTLSDPALSDPAFPDPALSSPALSSPALAESRPVLTHDGRVLTGEKCAPASEPAACPTPRRRLPPGVVTQLLRSAVSLQAEGLLRTAGALAGAWGGVLDRTEWIERDARDLSLLTAAAVAAQVPLPAGVDTGAADPQHPGSVVESLLAGHEALVRVLRQLAAASDDDDAGTSRESASWHSAVRGILSRREEEILLLRAVGARGNLPEDERYMRGRPPRP